MIFTGNNFRLTVGDQILVGETSTGVSWQGNIIEATTKPTGGFAEFISGTKSGSIQFEKLLSFDENLEVGNTYNFHIGGRRNGYVGQMIVESIEIGASSDELVSYSGSARVTGDLSKFNPDIAAQVLRTRSGEDILTRSGLNIEVNVLTN